MKRVVRLLICTSAAGLLFGCASKQMNQRIDEKVAAEIDVPSGTSLQTEVTDLIEKDSNLTDDQKAKLLEIQEVSVRQRKELELHSLKLRGVLVDDLLSPDFNQNEVDALKDRIRDDESKRLNILFNALAEVDKVLGHEKKPSHKRIMGRIIR